MCSILEAYRLYLLYLKLVITHSKFYKLEFGNVVV